MHILFWMSWKTLMVHLGKQCLSWTLCFLLKWSSLCLSSQVFVPVAGSWSFVPLLLLQRTTRRPTCTRGSDRSVTSIPQNAVSSPYDWVLDNVGTFWNFIIRNSWQKYSFYLCLKLMLKIAFYIFMEKKNKLWLILLLLHIFLNRKKREHKFQGKVSTSLRSNLQK